MKIRVGLFDQDIRYVNKLVNYFNVHYSDSLEMHTFSKIDAVLEQIKKRRIDLLLINPDCVEEPIDLPQSISMAYLSTSAGIDTIKGKKTICKYQKAELIYKEILNLYSELDKGISIKAWQGNCDMHVFIGASGGVGTSTIAAACARNLAENGRKVLYLNLESTGIVDEFFNGEISQGLSDMLYAIKSNHSNLILKLTSMVDKDQCGVFFLHPFTVSLDEEEMTAEELETLIDTLVSTGDFDSIVVDMDSNASEKRNLIANRADNIFVISSGLPISNRKLSKKLQEFVLIDERDDSRQFPHVQVMYNRFGSSSVLANTEHGETVFGTVNNYRDSNNREYSPRKLVEMIASRNLFSKLC